MRLYNIGTSFTGPQFSPLLIHDVSCGGGAERKAGGHDLCFDKTCQGNRLAICVVLVEKKRFE